MFPGLFWYNLKVSAEAKKEENVEEEIQRTRNALLSLCFSLCLAGRTASLHPALPISAGQGTGRLQLYHFFC